MIKAVVMVILVVSVLSGCASTSISDSGYNRVQGHSRHHNGEPVVSKELNELAVIGIGAKSKFDEAVIAQSLTEKKPFSLHANSRVLLLQSGARFPDSEMVSSMSKYWDVSTLSGDSRDYVDSHLNNVLRYTAATGGRDIVVVYWGVIESAKQDLQAKNISWIPLVGWPLADEKTQMRVVLKFAVIDVASGQWEMFQPEPVEHQFLSRMINRNGKSQQAEIDIKKSIYEHAAKALFNRLVTHSSGA